MSLDAIFFPHGGIQLHTFVSYALPCQTPFCQTAPLLSSVARQQNLTEYWRESSTSTAISTTFTSDVVGQHNKIGGNNFGAVLVASHILGITRYEDRQTALHLAFHPHCKLVGRLGVPELDWIQM